MAHDNLRPGVEVICLRRADQGLRGTILERVEVCPYSGGVSVLVDLDDSREPFWVDVRSFDAGNAQQFMTVADYRAKARAAVAQMASLRGNA